MNTNMELSGQQEGIAYIYQMLDHHGELCQYIRGVHLHQSLSGAYTRTHTGYLPDDFPADYLSRFGISYGHILKIDRHQPWTVSMVAELVDRIDPDYLTHELAVESRTDRRRAVLCQRRALAK